jgi:long-chain acyl-CoA synthetase
MRTLIDLLENSAQEYADNPYILEKKSDRYEALTYKETKEQVYKVAAGFLALGLKKGDRVALISESRNDWVISELGVLHTGAICVPLSILLKESSDLKFRLDHTESRWIIISANQYGKIDSIKHDLKSLEKIILLDPKESYAPNEIFIGKVKSLGEEYLGKNYNKFMEIIKSVGPDDFASICYTSGTTTDPKGVILSHRNYTANIEQTLTIIDANEQWTTLLILPWDHSLAHTLGLYLIMKIGSSLASVQWGKSYLDSIKHIPENIKEIRPFLMLSVPALAKNFRKSIEKAVRDRGIFVEKLFRHALKVAYWYNGIGWDRGKGLRIFLKPLVRLYDIILFKKIRANFGGRLKFFISTGAMLDIELQKFFYAIGIPMLQGYGLSEGSPGISVNLENRHKLGSSGIIFKNLDLKICNEEGRELPVEEKGEIIFRGENVMKGYWKNEKATNETIRNGWVHTGDIGYVDKDGFLYVLGRFKSLLISDTGEKYSPEAIEETITSRSRFIYQIMLYNNQCKYTSALLVPTREALAIWVKINNIDPAEPGGVVAVLNLLESVIKQYKQGGVYNDLFPSKWLPAAVVILDEPFSAENKLISGVGKMVRTKIIERYRDKIDFLYTPEAKNIVNQRNIDAIKKVLGIYQNEIRY